MRYLVYGLQENTRLRLLERFENVTHETPFVLRKPGTGKSFGAIALDVLTGRCKDVK